MFAKWFRRHANGHHPSRQREAAFRCELHVHSTYSDGSATPRQLVERAAALGLQALAITDHDTACGARVAVRYARDLGLELIPAIEFTARWDECRQVGWSGDVDVLGYFVDLDDAGLQVAEAAATGDIAARMADCCVSLSRAGYAVTLDEVYALNPRYAGMRFLRELLVRKGYASSEAEAGRLVHEHWLRVRPCALTLAQQIQTIHQAGGVAILAHPGYLRCDGELLGARHVAALVALGLDGLEVYHRSHDQATRAHFLALAEQFGLLVSGGSDEHGWSPDLPLLGTTPVTREMVEALRARHRQRLANSEMARMQQREEG
jgi:predicted metal-dependent phosphoesterase TrpH